MPDETTDQADDATEPVDQPSLPSHANRSRATVGWGADGAPVTREDFDDEMAGEKTTVEQPDAALMGPTSRQAVAAAASSDDAPADVPADVDTAEVAGKNAAEVITWIKDGETEGGEAEATRRAGVAWAAERSRSEGVRSTVEAEVDRWLEPADPA